MKVNYGKIENIYIEKLKIGDFFINNKNVYVVIDDEMTNRYFCNYIKALRLNDYTACVFSFGSIVQKVEVKSIDN